MASCMFNLDYKRAGRERRKEEGRKEKGERGREGELAYSMH